MQIVLRFFVEQGAATALTHGLIAAAVAMVVVLGLALSV